MASINFPSSPVHGSTYTFLGVRYIFIKQDSLGDPYTEGYWSVSTAGTYSAASIAEINAGIEGFKYISPLELTSTKYVREDESSGQTELNNLGVKKLNTTTSGVSISGTLGATGDSTIGGTLGVTGVITGTLNGNASSATKLQTARTIDITGDITATAVAFDGTSNISISAAVVNNSHTHTGSTISALDGGDITTGTISDARLPATISSNITGSSTSCTGNSNTASSATKLKTARTIDITGDIVATAVAFDGTSNIAISASVTNNSHTHTGSTISALDGGDITTGTISDARLPSTISSNITGSAGSAPSTYSKTSLFSGAASSGLVSCSSALSGFDAIMVETAGNSSVRQSMMYQRSLVAGNGITYVSQGYGGSWITYKFNASSLTIQGQYAAGGSSYIVRIYGIKY